MGRGNRRSGGNQVAPTHFVTAIASELVRQTTGNNQGSGPGNNQGSGPGNGKKIGKKGRKNGHNGHGGYTNDFHHSWVNVSDRPWYTTIERKEMIKAGTKTLKRDKYRTHMVCHSGYETDPHVSVFSENRQMMDHWEKMANIDHPSSDLSIARLKKREGIMYANTARIAERAMKNGALPTEDPNSVLVLQNATDYANFIKIALTNGWGELTPNMNESLNPFKPLSDRSNAFHLKFAGIGMRKTARKNDNASINPSPYENISVLNVWNEAAVRHVKIFKLYQEGVSMEFPKGGRPTKHPAGVVVNDPEYTDDYGEGARPFGKRIVFTQPPKKQAGSVTYPPQTGPIPDAA
jgi:hypothetical protein